MPLSDTTKITLPSGWPQAQHSQWDERSMLSPMQGWGTPQFQNVINPNVAPNLGVTPLGVNPAAWANWLQNNGQDRSLPNPRDATGVDGIYRQLFGYGAPADQVQFWNKTATDMGLNDNELMRYIASLNREAVNVHNDPGNPNGLNGPDPARTFGPGQRGGGGLGGLGGVSPQMAQWFDMIDQGRNAVAGINRMPGMFSNYGSISSDPATAYRQFYGQMGENGTGGVTDKKAPTPDDVRSALNAPAGEQGVPDLYELRNQVNALENYRLAAMGGR